jgi:N-acetylneuraminate synthase
MKNIKIGNFVIGQNYPVFVIAEAGINHNGSVNIAKKMVNVAKKAGAQCIKFQTHIVDKEMIKSDIKPGNISKKTLWNIIKSCELTENEEVKIIRYCKDKKILFLSTPFSKDAVDRLEKFKIPAYKIGSGELTNIPFLYYVAETKKPVILSTGMSTINDIRNAVNVFRKYGNPLALLQTTSTYPSDYEDIKLGAIEKLQKIFRVPVGISDHSFGIYTSLGAVAKGACIVEKHFTLDKNMPGPDQKFSLEPSELAELVKGCHAVKIALGDTKIILDRERPILRFARASVVSIKGIQKGEKFSEKNISTKRPGIGSISAKEYYKLIGRIAKRRIANDKQLSWADVS